MKTPIYLFAFVECVSRGIESKNPKQPTRSLSPFKPLLALVQIEQAQGKGHSEKGKHVTDETQDYKIVNNFC